MKVYIAGDKVGVLDDSEIKLCGCTMFFWSGDGLKGQMHAGFEAMEDAFNKLKAEVSALSDVQHVRGEQALILAESIGKIDERLNVIGSKLRAVVAGNTVDEAAIAKIDKRLKALEDWTKTHVAQSVVYETPE